MHAFRRRVSYANVVATLALFLALGGTSYAALTITGKQVKNSSLTGKDVKNKSLGGADLKGGSLLSSHFKAGQLPSGPAGSPGSTGPAGPVGPVGPVGPAGGVSGLQIVEALSASNSIDKEITATCPAGKKVIGGGGAIVDVGSGGVALERSLTEDGVGAAWTARGHEHDATAANWRVLAQAICANVAP